MGIQRLIYLGLLGSGLFLSSCEREQVSLGDLEERIQDLESKFAGVKKTASQLRRELAQLSDSRAKLESEADEARLAVTDVLNQQTELVKAFETYRMDYHDAIIRRATGLELGEVLIDGVTYRGTRVKSLDAWEVSLQHNAGVTRFDLVDLPEEWKTRFGYDPTVGPKPAPSLAATIVMPQESSSDTPAPAAVAAASSAPAAAAQARPVFAPLSARSSSQECTSGSSKTSSSRRGSGSEIITRFQGVGMGGGGGSSGGGTQIKGGKSELPQGYKPIGSSFSGTAMDRNYKKDKR